MECFSFEGGRGRHTVVVHVSSHLKEELALATDKRLLVISTIMLFKKQL